ncbi:hypothetical protein Cni_G12026 [Canna indica]|uniref:Uncharacterized protein n=1 Tax=Canna indica TaxID=4628 RepID=A0AAQ3Q8N1_9LILI|nr:hypothetical protein Cni_G12026 [Canna indica]
MDKVYPEPLLLPSSSPPNASSSMTATREVFTLWMKSLVLNGNGCAVFDSDGQLAYRVDNYDSKCSDEVYLMDKHGTTLCKILRRRFRVLGRWEGYRFHDLNGGEDKRPWFRVIKKSDGILKSSEIRVMVGCSKGNEACYRVEGLGNKLVFKIKDLAGKTVAEVGRKQTERGVVLGEDVLMLVVEANIDRLLIMGLIVVCGLMKQNM